AVSFSMSPIRYTSRRRSAASLRSVWRTASINSATRRSFSSPIAHHYRIGEKLSFVRRCMHYRRTAGGPSAGARGNEVKRKCEDRVDRDELQALDPVALPVHDDDGRCQDRQADSGDFEG